MNYYFASRAAAPLSPFLGAAPNNISAGPGIGIQRGAPDGRKFLPGLPSGSRRRQIGRERPYVHKPAGKAGVQPDPLRRDCRESTAPFCFGGGLRLTLLPHQQEAGSSIEVEQLDKGSDVLSTGCVPVRIWFDQPTTIYFGDGLRRKNRPFVTNAKSRWGMRVCRCTHQSVAIYSHADWYLFGLAAGVLIGCIAIAIFEMGVL